MTDQEIAGLLLTLLDGATFQGEHRVKVCEVGEWLAEIQAGERQTIKPSERTI